MKVWRGLPLAWLPNIQLSNYAKQPDANERWESEQTLTIPGLTGGREARTKSNSFLL